MNSCRIFPTRVCHVVAAQAQQFACTQDVLFQARFSSATKLVPGQLLAACTSYLPSLQGNAQQDAHEFLHLLLDVLDRVRLHSDREKCTLAAKPFIAMHASTSCSCTLPSHETYCLEASGMTSKRQSLATHTFGGVLQSDITCECGNVSSRLEPFMDISVDVGSQHHHHAAAGVAEQRGRLDVGRDGEPSTEPCLSVT